MIEEKLKKKVISYCDYLLEKRWKNTIYKYDLTRIRNKYIYKDICYNELRNDVELLKEFKKLDEMFRYEKGL